MNNKEYAELLDFVHEKTSELDNVNLYRVHSSYDPKSGEIGKVTLKVNYTKDGSPLPEEPLNKLPKRVQKNISQRNVNFRGDSCNKEKIYIFANDTNYNSVGSYYLYHLTCYVLLDS